MPLLGAPEHYGGHAWPEPPPAYQQGQGNHEPKGAGKGKGKGNLKGKGKGKDKGQDGFTGPLKLPQKHNLSPIDLAKAEVDFWKSK
eukprot:5400587-Pyramimonas_sp.AAC.1